MPTGVYKRRRSVVSRACQRCSANFETRPWLVRIGKGKYCGKKCSDRSTLFREGPEHRLGGDKHPLWKGDKASYTAKHIWIRTHAGTPSLCEDCGTTQAKKFEWANISKQYKRELTDWKRLCVQCHRKYDGHSAKAWATRRNNNG